MAAGVADGKGVVLRQNIDNRGPDPGRAALRQKGRLQAAGAGLGGEAPPGQVLGQGGAGFPLRLAISACFCRSFASTDTLPFFFLQLFLFPSIKL